MSASFTFGSFGDIITTVQLVWRLSQAISDSHGSAQEFRELVDELNLFHKTLDELLNFWQSRSRSAELDRLADSLKPAVDECREAIESFFKRQFRQYASSFSPQKKSRKSIGDIFKRIRWSVLEKEKVTQLRNKLRRNKELIDWIHAIASGIGQEQDRDLVAARLESLANAEAQAANQLDKQFVKVLGYLETHTTVATKTEKNVVAVLSELRTANSRISSVQAEIASLSRVPDAIDPYRYNRVLIEDALGSTIPVPLDINPSWQTIESMVRDQFRNRPGQALVMKKKYVLHDLATGTDLNLKADFHHLVRPGQTLAMAMTFGADVDSTGSANPRCSFIFRKVLDFSDMDDDAIDKWLAQPEHDQNSKAFLNDEYNGNDNLSLLLAERENMEGPDIFKRVRYISRWEDLEDSRGSLSATMNGIRFWGIGDNGWAIEAVWNIRALAVAEANWQVHERELAPIFGENTCWYRVQFAGYTRKTSVPVLTVITGSQDTCQRIVKALRTLDFIRDGRIQLAVLGTDQSLPQDWLDGIRRRYELTEPEPHHVAFDKTVQDIIRKRQRMPHN
ncbi:hypothetical protein PFICI_02758 [Pestalotiopsis fici W106-1]|uniref:Ubiquitin-like domain-containing protein n=1 Tax=Pestalotiopsis fici (strain W106-1 / CGMCC3.15140) TaxID=1229662 RepID=W3XF80_PESFW|nr:uncharacterized protein PFICI_02758 [Pestalotiopsis fici W106-1]ETS84733.1 hypothetical protein PFICI_02758 [Pestalotiopsis fici W106-1]